VSLIFVSPAVEADPGADFDCRTRLADVSAAPAFRDFPVSPSVPARPAKLKLISPDARMFRTTLQEGAAKGANFAGHYAIVVWGCGSSCSDLAIVDTRSGDVHFDNRVRDISTVNVNDEPGREQPEFWAARFRPDSRLLVIVGAPQEDEARDGITYYEWSGSRLKLLRFVPRAQACTPVSRSR